MSRFLFTTLQSNDLGLLTRSLPIARELRALGHEVIFCSPGAAPRKVVADAGFDSRIPDEPLYNLGDPGTLPRVLRSGHRWRDLRLLLRLGRHMSRNATAEIWDVDHFFQLMGLADADLLRLTIPSLIRVLRDARADAVVDFWNPMACVAARATGTPLVGVVQANTHPASDGFIWWRERPAALPSPVPAYNEVLAELDLPSVQRVAELMLGDLTLVLGMPETDPLPPGAVGGHIGAVLWERPGTELPDWLARLARGRPLVWLYPGNVRYMRGSTTPFDSLVVLDACVEALRDESVQVVLATGHQPLPRRFRRLPANFHVEPFVPGLSLATRCSVMIHHGGYGSCQTGLWAGCPAVIVPTYSERESNARRVAAAGAGLVVLPETDARGVRKHVPPEALRNAVRRVLGEPAFAQNAAAMSEKLRGYGGAPLAARLIAETLARVPA